MDTITFHFHVLKLKAMGYDITETHFPNDLQKENQYKAWFGYGGMKPTTTAAQKAVAFAGIIAGTIPLAMLTKTPSLNLYTKVRKVV